MRNKIVFAAALLGACLRLAAQGEAEARPANAPPQAPRLRVMVDFSGPEGAESQGYGDSLDSILIQSPSVLAVVKAPAGDDPLPVKAERDACSLALGVRLELTGDGSRLSWEVYLPPRSDPADRGTEDRGFPDARGLATTYWQGPLAAMEGAIGKAEIPSSSVKIVGAPGTKVEGIGAEIVLPESGEIDIPVVLPAYISWSAEAEGARPESGQALIKESGARITVPRRPLKAEGRWSIDLSALGGSYPELSARYDLGSRLFARATLSQYFLGLYLGTQDSGSSGANSIMKKNK